MATAASQLQGLMTLGNALGLTKPQGQKTTQTSGNNISQAGLEYLMNQALSGPGGLAAIGAQARGSGLYNSTTEELLKNDASARAAGEAATRGATTTTTQQTQATGGTLNPSALILPALGLLNNSGLLGQGASAISNFFNPISAAPGVTLAGQGIAANTLAGAGASQGAATLASTLGGSLAGAGSGAGSVLSSLAGSGAGTAAGTAAGSAITAAPGLTLANAGTALGSTAGTAAGSAAAGAGGNFALSSIPGVGSVLGGLLSGGGVADTSLEAFLGSVAAGAAASGPVGMVAAPVMMTFGAMLNDLGISVVCTALMKQGLLDKAKYERGQAYLRTLHPWTIKGYYSWGRKLAAAIDRKSARATKLALPWATSRTNLICSTGLSRFFKYPLGTITQFVGQPLCFVLGGVITGLEKLKEFRNGSRANSSTAW